MPKQYKLGTTNGQKDKQEQLIVEAGLHSNTWQTHALDNGNFSVLVRAAATGRTIKIDKRIPVYDRSAGVYRFDVDFDMQLDEMIEEGRYDQFDPNFTTDLFPIVGKGMIEFEGKIFNFGQTSSDVAENKIKSADRKRPWTPASIGPLLGFGAAFPSMKLSFIVAGLGSVAKVGGNSHVPYLTGSSVSRDVELSLGNGAWGEHCRFLGVRLALPNT